MPCQSIKQVIYFFGELHELTKDICNKKTEKKAARLKKASVATGSNCVGRKCTYKIGDTGPGGGLIFFVDYLDQYSKFNYLEAAPSDLGNGPATMYLGKSKAMVWCSDGTSSALAARQSRVGRGQPRTTAMLTSAPPFMGCRSGAGFATDA